MGKQSILHGKLTVSGRETNCFSWETQTETASFGVQDHQNGMPIPHPLRQGHAYSVFYLKNNVICKTHRFRMQNCHFWNAKLPLLECKTATFRTQNAPFWNAKRTVLEITPVCLGMQTVSNWIFESTLSSHNQSRTFFIFSVNSLLSLYQFFVISLLNHWCLSVERPLYICTRVPFIYCLHHRCGL